MNNGISRGGVRAALLALIGGLVLATGAMAQVWEAGVQPGGYGVARITGPGPATGLALTCEGDAPVLALSLARPAPRNPAPFAFAIGGRTAQGVLTRNGATNVWAMHLRQDRALVDLLTQGDSVTVTVAGAPYGALSLQGARPALQRALSRCYTPPAIQAVATPPVAPMAGAPTAGADAPVRGLYRDITGGAQDAGRWFTPGYRALESECSRTQELMARRGRDDETFGQCGEDASSLCQCQDMDEQVLRRTLAVSVAPVSAGVARVSARFRVFSSGDPIDVRFRVVRTAQGWLIDDILYDGPFEQGDPKSERELFLNGINDMRKSLRMSPISAPPLAQPAG
ncbi:hypothetical protein [Phenylobacterium sp. SCN 70-31]|uniref:hypothetical protein n=1 Tax=Phenylobacterium sp. SCN 70-31 TaxID=1660129 RepID=UPI000869F38A|nr:hypothetical protein [Phenylobacterium sp. SCN 70-31]ODT88091.1 MAG: hypothetical protein ABS78_09355 [Phenylobacterium sp. SCN 70-31]